MPRRADRTPNLATADGSAGERENLPIDLARSPAVLAACRRLREEVERGRLSEVDRCLVSLMVAQRSGSAGWLAAQLQRGRRAGLSEEQLEAAREGCAGSSRQTALLFLAGRMVVNRGHLAEADLQAIRQAGLSDDEMLEAILQVAMSLATITASHAARHRPSAVRPPRSRSHEFGASRN